ncbi:OmpA family protein [Mesorhizobium sp.]|uniref:OmpA family protein n=1 Tax=Mesorhizobium sp. TaxID=1871066 RepID=UPI000FE546C7|nr:OmpA family protein [Mesorhizobium sp.]RWD81317.1 MAG: OmpA family protein [Mesorhizobium sp.]
MRSKPVLVAALLVSLPAHAEDVTSEAIIEALVPKIDQTGGKQQPGLRDLRGVDLSQPDPATAAPLSIDIRVTFAYDSSELDADAIVTLRRLGEALSDDRLASYSFLIAGHTDSRGTDEYNQRLSEARAKSVVGYLVHSMDIRETRLTAKGLGESQLFDPGNPEDGINRRVQIVNLGEQR